jgi:hypothetical protein
MHAGAPGIPAVWSSEDFGAADAHAAAGAEQEQERPLIIAVGRNGKCDSGGWCRLLSYFSETLSRIERSSTGDVRQVVLACVVWTRKNGNPITARMIMTFVSQRKFIYLY